MAAVASIEQKSQQGTDPLPQRVLGKTGESVPKLGLGTGPTGYGMKDENAISLIHRAIDLGVTAMDTAPGYARAQVQLGEVMKERRREVFLITKTPTDDYQTALDKLEKNLNDLQTDYVDVTYVHCLGAYDPERVLSQNGSLAGLREAQRRGWTRFVGFTAHNQPQKSAKVLREADIDVVMLAMNFADRHTYNFEEEVLPLAAERQVGVVAMKVFGGAPNMNYKKQTPSALDAAGDYDHQLAFRYALGLPGVTMAVIGMYTEEELEKNIEWVRSLEPLTIQEERRLAQRGKELAGEWGPHYGPVQ